MHCSCCSQGDEGLRRVGAVAVDGPLQKRAHFLVHLSAIALNYGSVPSSAPTQIFYFPCFDIDFVSILVEVSDLNVVVC